MTREQESLTVLTEQIIRAINEMIRPLERQLKAQGDLLDKLIRYLGTDVADAIGYKYYKRGNYK